MCLTLVIGGKLFASASRMLIECDDSETVQGFVYALEIKDVAESAVEMAKQSMVNKFKKQGVNATDTLARRAI